MLQQGISSEGAVVKGNMPYSDMVNVWGTKEKKAAVWEQMTPGDGVLYYTKEPQGTVFRFYGTVSCIIDSPELSMAIWQSPEFRYIHVCEDTPEIFLDKFTVLSFLGYKMTKVQGFMRVQSERWKAISEQYENMEEIVQYLAASDYWSLRSAEQKMLSVDFSDQSPERNLKRTAQFYEDLYDKLENGKIRCCMQNASAPPEHIKEPGKENGITRATPNFAGINRIKEGVGKIGEQIVYQMERDRLIQAGQETLSQRVEIVSKKSNQYGYDIRSWDIDEKERCIEVKTTTKGKETPFQLTFREMNEWQTNDRFMIIRIYDLKISQEEVTYKYYQLGYADREKVKAEPVVYSVFR